MEIKVYWQVLMRKWWIVVPTFIVTLTATIVLTFTQLPVYETTATFVVSPNTRFDDAKSFLTGLDTLSRRSEIASTYAEIATSRSIKMAAATALGLSPEQKKSLTVDSQLLAGTNILRITVQGNDPSLVRDFANAVGAETVVYARELYELHDLKALDSATRPTSPIRPNKPLYLGLGGTLGLALAAGLAFFAEYLQTPLQQASHLSLLDDETGAYNERYLVQRLDQEMSRAKRNKYHLSLALLRVHCPDGVGKSPLARSEVLRKVSTLLRRQLRKEDILARYDELDFAFVLPDVPGADAKASVEELLTKVMGTPFEIQAGGAVKCSLASSSGVVEYEHNGTEPNELLEQARQALEQAELADYGGVFLWPQNGDPDESRPDAI
jgi:diguanylate cyclase (GGDEF)-like protein